MVQLTQAHSLYAQKVVLQSLYVLWHESSSFIYLSRLSLQNVHGLNLNQPELLQFLKR